uniref:G-protein coupled receptors family 1 profile domain-containing protein n=1 Tax=Romanomermis culicivorax TaxID=13658 RepID=A0A915IAX5_ROMCU
MLVYILALSIVDCFVLLNLPFIISDIVHESWIFGELLCKLHYIGDNLNKTMSTLILTTLSFDRYLSVCHPYSFLRWRSVKITVAIISACVLFGLCLLLPLFFSTGLNALTFPDGVTVTKCSYIETDYNVEHCTRRRDTVHMITKRMIIVIVFYFACWTPYWGANLSIHLSDDWFNVSILNQTEDMFSVGDSTTIVEDWGSSGFARWGPVVFLVLYLLVYANSAVNPFLYGVFNLELKRQRQNVLLSVRRPRMNSATAATTGENRSFRHFRSFFGKPTTIVNSPKLISKPKYDQFPDFERHQSYILTSSNNGKRLSTDVTMILLSKIPSPGENLLTNTECDC